MSTHNICFRGEMRKNLPDTHSYPDLQHEQSINTMYRNSMGNFLSYNKAVSSASDCWGSQGQIPAWPHNFCGDMIME